MSLRPLVHLLARYTMYMVNLMISLFQILLSPVDLQGAIDQVMFWVAKLVNIIKDMLVQIGNIIFKILFEMSSWGSVMETIIHWICVTLQLVMTVLKAVYCEVVRPIINFIKDLINALISAVEDVVNGICIGTCNFKLGSVRDVLDLIHKLLYVDTKSFCENDDTNICRQMFSNQPPEELTG
eukprot:772720-Rhodomonas_salina.1